MSVIYPVSLFHCPLLFPILSLFSLLCPSVSLGVCLPPSSSVVVCRSSCAVSESSCFRTLRPLLLVLKKQSSWQRTCHSERTDVTNSINNHCSRAPGSHDRVTVGWHEQHPVPETEATSSDSAIISFFIYTCAFSVVVFQMCHPAALNLLLSLTFHRWQHLKLQLLICIWSFISILGIMWESNSNMIFLYKYCVFLFWGQDSNICQDFFLSCWRFMNDKSRKPLSRADIDLYFKAPIESQSRNWSMFSCKQVTPAFIIHLLFILIFFPSQTLRRSVRNN